MKWDYANLEERSRCILIVESNKEDPEREEAGEFVNGILDRIIDQIKNGTPEEREALPCRRCWIFKPKAEGHGSISSVQSCGQGSLFIFVPFQKVVPADQPIRCRRIFFLWRIEMNQALKSLEGAVAFGVANGKKNVIADLYPLMELIQQRDELYRTLQRSIAWLRRLEIEHPGCLNSDAIDKHLMPAIALVEKQ